MRRTLEREDVFGTHPGLCTPSAGLCPSPAPSLLRTFCGSGPLHPPFLPRCVCVSLALHVAATPALRGSLRGPDTVRVSLPPQPPARFTLFCFLSIAHLCVRCLLIRSSNRCVFPSRRGAPETRAVRHSCPLRAGRALHRSHFSGPPVTWPHEGDRCWGCGFSRSCKRSWVPPCQ